MIGDLNRPSTPTFIKSNALAITLENTQFVFNFPDGATVDVDGKAFTTPMRVEGEVGGNIAP